MPGCRSERRPGPPRPIRWIRSSLARGGGHVGLGAAAGGHRTGGGVAARADGARFHRGVQAEVLDERVDPRVVDVVELELVAPDLQRDVVVEADDGRHQHVVLALDLLLERVDLVGRQALLVGHPDGTVLEAVYGVLVGDRGVVDVTHAVLPQRVVVTADRRAGHVRQGAVFVLAGFERLVLLGPVVDDALDVGGLVLPAARAADDREHAVAEDAEDDHADDAADRDRAPVAAAGDLDRGDRLAALAAALRPGSVAARFTGSAGFAGTGLRPTRRRLALAGRLADLDRGRD